MWDQSSTDAGFFLSILVSPANSHFTKRFISLMYHPGLVQWAIYDPCTRDAVYLQPRNEKDAAEMSVSVLHAHFLLQAGRSRDRVPMRWIFSNLPNPSGRTMALGSTRPLTEMSTRNLKKETWG
jgi:hypothetical protein